MACIKVQLLVYYLILAVTIIKSDDDFFMVVEKSKSNLCITNSSNALAWISAEIQSDSNSITSKYIPGNIDESHSCTIDPEAGCNYYWHISPWTNADSIKLKYNEFVLDRRWEQFPTKTASPFKYEIIASGLPRDFELPISIRSYPRGLSIMICDNQWNPSNANCYWISLYAWGGSKTLIKKCFDKKLPNPFKFPGPDCGNDRISRNEKGNTQYLFQDEWRHFKLSRVAKTISFTQSGEKTPIISFKDDVDWIDSWHIFVIKSRNEPRSLLKVHQLKFLHAEYTGDVTLGSTLYIDSSQFYVSLFVKQCTYCKITLLAFDYTTGRSIEERSYTNQGTDWQHISFSVQKETSNGVYFQAKLELLHGTDRFFDIDDFHVYSKNYRLIRSQYDSNAKCQLVSQQSSRMISIKKIITTVAQSSCTVYEIQPNCVPCNWFNNDPYNLCHDIKICTETRCTCSAGYTSDTCNQICQGKTFGYGCREKCGRCGSDGNCNEITGICYTHDCIKGFTGNQCKIPPGTIFDSAPVLRNQKYTWCEVQMTNLVILGLEDEPTAYEYIFQYATRGVDWSDYDRKIAIDDDRVIKIENLKSSNVYYIRPIILKNNEKTYVGPYVEYVACNLTCREIENEDIIINETTNTTVTFQIKINEEICKISKYIFKVNNKIANCTNLNLCQVNHLEPFTRYEIVEFKTYRISKEFKTKEGMPSQVQEVKYGIKDNTISLNWTKPLKINAENVNYVIRYRHLNYRSCSPKLTKTENYAFRIETDETFTHLDNLEPYSSYQVNVSAKNVAIEGNAVVINFMTDASEIISDEEIPSIEGINVLTSTSVSITLTQIKCEHQRGSLYMKRTINCLSEWCRDEQIVDSIRPYSTETIFDSLEPFTVYNVTLTVCRNDRNDRCAYGKTIQTHFRTSPDSPGPVRNLLVYSKDDNYISLRWQPPYPPTGIISNYRISYTTSYTIHRNEQATVDVENVRCQLWPEFICATVEDIIHKSTFYEFQIRATNEDPPNKYGSVRATSATAIKDKPDPPYDLRLSWDRMNRLIVSWTHPNVTNGELDSFQIESNATTIPIPPINVNRTVYNLTYTRSIGDIVPSDMVWVRVRCRNSEYTSDWSDVRSDSSPPPIPELHEDYFRIVSANTSMSIEIQLKTDNYVKDESKLFLLIYTERSNVRQPKGIDLGLFRQLDPPESLTNYQILTMYDIPSIGGLVSFKTSIVNVKNDTDDSKIEYPIEPNTDYTIKIVLINTFHRKVRSTSYNVTKNTSDGYPPETADGNGGLYGALVIISIILIAISVMVWKRQSVVSWYNSKSRQISNMRLTRRRNDLEEEEEEQVLPSIDMAMKVPPQIKHPKPKVIPPKTHSKRIKIVEFETYIKQSLVEGELERQHLLFPRGKNKPCDCGELKANKSKNRYNNLIAYDHTRVRLDKIDGDEYSDYINANYIDGYNVPRAYIATQGPKANTLYDFWRMIWQENVQHIVMLANVYEGRKKKVEKYWPDANMESLQFKDITVTFVSNSVYADYEFRQFYVTRREVKREVDQLHYTTWPDHGVPLYSQSLVPFLQNLLKIPSSSKSPVVIHCSAGVGRTGTVLLCDIGLRMAARDGFIDMLEILHRLRDQRANLVDNVQQYKLAHIVILECLFGMHTAIPCNEIKESIERLRNKDGFKSQMRYLEDTVWQDQAMNDVVAVDDEDDVNRNAYPPEKNRFDDIIPEIQGRVFLARYPSDDEKSSYINAVRVDGFRAPGRFIVTQQPLPNTIGDFWRLVGENDIEVIVNLNAINDSSDPSSCYFWPVDGLDVLNPVDYIKIRHSGTKTEPFYDLVNLEVDFDGSVPVMNKNVKIISLTKWKPWEMSKDPLPLSSEQFLRFWEDCDVLTRRSDKVLLTCYDGTTACGLYAALSFIIEKIKLEQVCDVCQAVRSIRHNRQQFINEEQFVFLYECAENYINRFQLYDNFN